MKRLNTTAARKKEKRHASSREDPGHRDPAPAEASGLPEAMRQALAAGEKDRYLDLMVRENAIPNVIRKLI